jgi:hypothetical protein
VSEIEEVDRRNSSIISSGLPPEVRYLLLNKAHLPWLSERFTDAAHDADYQVACSSGLALLATYLLIYPTYYPLNGE